MECQQGLVHVAHLVSMGPNKRDQKTIFRKEEDEKFQLLWPSFWSLVLGCPPSQDASHHQDDITFLGSGIPT